MNKKVKEAAEVLLATGGCLGAFAGVLGFSAGVFFGLGALVETAISLPNYDSRASKAARVDYMTNNLYGENIEFRRNGHWFTTNVGSRNVRSLIKNYCQTIYIEANPVKMEFNYRTSWIVKIPLGELEVSIDGIPVKDKTTLKALDSIVTNTIEDIERQITPEYNKKQREEMEAREKKERERLRKQKEGEEQAYQKLQKLKQELGIR